VRSQHLSSDGNLSAGVPKQSIQGGAVLRRERQQGPTRSEVLLDRAGFLLIEDDPKGKPNAIGDPQAGHAGSIAIIERQQTARTSYSHLARYSPAERPFPAIGDR